MKHIYLLFLCITSIGFAQIPSDYYDSANGLSGFALKTELKNILTNGHVDQGYGALYTAYVTTHSDNIAESGYENDNTILLFYTENPNGVDPYVFNHGSNNCGNYSSENDCYNREHIVPQSAFGSANPMRNDIHHVIPSDGFVNGQRGSLPFGTVGSANYTSLNGSKRGNSTVPGYSGNVFEPIDEFKGDIARAILYFVTRYEDNVDGYSGYDMFNGTENQALEDWAVTMLLDWHYNVDPVDQREIDRNNATYNFQGNANPFVDHPEYANLIWVPLPDTEAPTAPTNLVASGATDTSIELSWTASTDNIAVTSYDIYIDGVFAFNAGSTTATVNGLTVATNYCFTIKAKDAANNESGFSNQDCETTTDNGSGSTDCLVETFENIGASSGSYTDITWSGDNGATWNATDARTDQNLNGRSIAVRNGSITLPSTAGGIGEFTVTTQRIFGGSSGTFNLNVNGSTVGTIAYSNTIETITIPNINIEGSISIVIDSNSTPGNRVKFDDLTYTCYSQLSVEAFNSLSVNLQPNPTQGKLQINLKSNVKTQVEIFNILGKRVFSQEINTSQEVNLQSLQSGIYIVKLSQNNATINKKLIKN